MARGATDDQVRLFAGENLIRVWGNIEVAAEAIQASGEKPVEKFGKGGAGGMGIRACRSCLPEAETSLRDPQTTPIQCKCGWEACWLGERLLTIVKLKQESIINIKTQRERFSDYGWKWSENKTSSSYQFSQLTTGYIKAGNTVGIRQMKAILPKAQLEVF
jgi:hypothetical protein